MEWYIAKKLLERWRLTIGVNFCKDPTLERPRHFLKTKAFQLLSPHFLSDANIFAYYEAVFHSVTNNTRCSAIAERPRCWVHYFWPKVEDWNSETIFYWHYTSVFNHCDIIGSKAIEFGEKREIRAITPSKIIQGHGDRYKAKAHMRLHISD